MQTRSLKGNLLSLYLALALDLPKKAGALHASWDEWQYDLRCDGHPFGPFDTPNADSSPLALQAVIPHATRWQLASRPMGTGKWLVETPDGNQYLASGLVHAYAIAIIAGVFGEEVADTYEDPHYKKTIFLPPYNVHYGETIPYYKAPTAATFAAQCDPCSTYGQALHKARHLIKEGLIFNYHCDGHSWLQVQLLDGSSHWLYRGESTIGLPSLAPA